MKKFFVYVLMSITTLVANALVLDKNASFASASEMSPVKVSTNDNSQMSFLSPDGKEFFDGEIMNITPEIDPDWGDVIFEAPSIKNNGSEAVNAKLGINIISLPANTAVQECFGVNCFFFDKEGSHETSTVNISAGATKSTATEWQCYDAEKDEYAIGTCTIQFTLYVNGVKDITVTVNYINTLDDITFHLNAASKKLKVGESFALEAYYNKNENRNNNISWSSSDSDIATVDQDGIVYAKSEGTSYVTAVSTEDTNLSATCLITVYQQKVESLILSSNNISLFEGDKSQLEVTVKPDDAVNKYVEWYTSNPDVVLVSDNGLMTAIKSGNATITVMAKDGSNVTATCAVTVKPIKAQSITISNTSVSLDPGDTYQLEATVLPENTSDNTVIWTSSNSNIASVSSTGLVTAKTYGEVTITAKTNDGSNLSDKCIVSVSPIIATSINIEPESVSILEGEEKELSVSFTPSNVTFKDVVWLSLDETIATVASNGIVKGNSVGKAYIVARTTDGSNLAASCEVNVNPVLATGISLSTNSQDVVIGNTVVITAALHPANTTIKTIEWSSADSDIAKVEDGVVYALNIGKTIITAKTTDGTNISASCEINVLPIVAQSLSISQTSAEMFIGDELYLTASISPSNTTYTDLIWNTSDESIASVNNGHVVALSDGEANISVRTTDGSNLIAICKLTVKYIPVKSIVFSETNYSVPEGETLELDYTITPDNATYPELEWETNDANIASVENGIVSALKQGIAIITARATDGSGVLGMCAIVVTEPSGIFNIQVYDNVEGIYTFDGKKVQHPHGGMYIVRFTDGTVKKLHFR